MFGHLFDAFVLLETDESVDAHEVEREAFERHTADETFVKLAKEVLSDLTTTMRNERLKFQAARGHK